MTEPVFRISNALVEAFEGYFEEQLDAAWALNEAPDYMNKAEAIRHLAQLRILRTWPEERLRVYLEWNGIIGFTQTIYSIAIGRLA